MNIWYMSGAGNDFMVMDARGGDYDFEKLAVKLCAQTNADGFMALDSTDQADFRLHFYNSDGTRGEMCGNGARCICKFAYDHGVVGESMSVLTDAGIVYGWRLGENQYRVQLNNPGILDLNRKGEVSYVELGNPGVPHGVTQVKDLRKQDRKWLFDYAKALRWDPAFPKGANINMYEQIAPGEVNVLTFERGVEDFTLACGTGCGSLAVTLWAKGELPEGKMVAHNEGGDLAVTVQSKDQKIEKLLLEGPAELVKEFDYEWI